MGLYCLSDSRNSLPSIKPRARVADIVVALYLSFNTLNSVQQITALYNSSHGQSQYHRERRIPKPGVPHRRGSSARARSIKRVGASIPDAARGVFRAWAGWCEFEGDRKTGGLHAGAIYSYFANLEEITVLYSASLCNDSTKSSMMPRPIREPRLEPLRPPNCSAPKWKRSTPSIATTLKSST